jgi:adenosine kinase
MLLGCVGNDEYGKRIKSELGKVGVNSVLETIDTHPSSRCGAAILKKERCLIPDIMASRHLSESFVNQQKPTFGNVDFYFIEGYFIIERHNIVVDLINFFRENKRTKIGFTLSATFMIENFYDRVKEIADHSDVIFCNEDEAEAFAKQGSKDPEVNSLAIHKLLNKNENRILVVTCGHHPVIITKFDYKHNQLEYVIKQFVPLVPSELIVDTNGCGDCN